MLQDSRRCSPTGSSSAVARSAPGRSMVAGPSWRDTPSGSLAEQVALHRRVSAADCRLVAYTLAGHRPVAVPVALAVPVENRLAAGESAALAAYTRPSPGADRPRARAPAAARPAAGTPPAAQLAAWLRVVYPRAVCRRPCHLSPRAADSTRAGWDLHRRLVAGSMSGALGRQQALPEEPSASRRQNPALPEERLG